MLGIGKNKINWKKFIIGYFSQGGSDDGSKAPRQHATADIGRYFDIEEYKYKR